MGRQWDKPDNVRHKENWAGFLKNSIKGINPYLTRHMGRYSGTEVSLFLPLNGSKNILERGEIR